MNPQTPQPGTESEEQETEPDLNRRGILGVLAVLGVFGSGAYALFTPGESKLAIASAAPYVKPEIQWQPSDFYEFLLNLPQDSRLALKKTIGLLPQEATTSDSQSVKQDVRDIQREALWLSSNVLTYGFRDEKNLDYHAMVQWVAVKKGVHPTLAEWVPTFRLERELQKQLFSEMWDQLSPEEREKLLTQLDPYESIKDRTALVMLSGSAALATLSTTVAFSGFAFYTTMTTTMAAVAASLGLTLPFSAYAGASTLVGVLSGPVGWTIIGVTALGSVALAGRANVQKTALLVAAVHSLKVEALVAAGLTEPEVFGTATSQRPIDTSRKKEITS